MTEKTRHDPQKKYRKRDTKRDDDRRIGKSREHKVPKPASHSPQLNVCFPIKLPPNKKKLKITRDVKSSKSMISSRKLNN